MNKILNELITDYKLDSASFKAYKLYKMQEKLKAEYGLSEPELDSVFNYINSDTIAIKLLILRTFDLYNSKLIKKERAFKRLFALAFSLYGEGEISAEQLNMIVKKLHKFKDNRKIKRGGVVL